MRHLLKDKEHLYRMALLFIAGVFLFFVLQKLLVPKGWGLYGHYRAGALADNRARDPVFAGKPACVECHVDVPEAQKGGRHASIGCEACHGALGKHAADPSALKPARPDPRTLCLTCHRSNVAKPKGFKQVDPKDHMDGAPCGECHVPHNPGKAPEPKAAAAAPAKDAKEVAR